MKKATFKGPPCEKCGKALPTRKNVADWLDALLDRSHATAAKCGIFPGGTDLEFAMDVEAFAHASLTSWADALRGICGDCSYAAETVKAEEWFHVEARKRWAARPAK